MAYWNSGAVFNRRGEQKGFTWNSQYFLFVVRLNDSLQMIDGLSELLARLVLSDDSASFYDEVVNSAFYGHLVDEFSFEEDTKVSLLFAIAEEIGVKDELTDYIVSLFLSEKWEAIENIKLLANIWSDDAFVLEEKTALQAFYSLRDAYKLEDVKAESLVWLYLYDKFSLTDRDIKQAITDFLIGAIEDDDRAYDYFSPMYVQLENRRVGMRIDWKNTEIAHMPEAEHTIIEVPGTDGSIIQNTVYKDRLFKITMFSDDGLTISQKEDLKRRIDEVLDATKRESKKLTVQARGIMFDAKYNSSDISDGPSYVKAEVEFNVGPYGQDIFPNTLNGSGLVSNIEGAAPLHVVHKISGPITNPSFQFGTITYSYKGTVPSAKTLVIDHDKLTCYIVDNFGVKTNSLKDLTGEFQSIEPGGSIVLVADKTTESHLVTEWLTPLLW